MHGTFLILLAWVGVSHYLQRHHLANAGAGVVFILALFAIIVLHELGHALTARHYGIRTRDITLLPIGGVARLERMPDNPKELVVALAGPAVNVALAALLAGIVTPTADGVARRPVDRRRFPVKAPVGDVSLAVFNLIPAFPMDGGRALRAVLAMRMDYVRATQIAAHIGQGLALFSNPFSVFIALFVWMGAASEASAALTRSVLRGSR
jgi:Zn-dependent protease